MNRRSAKAQGFTIVELLIVIVVIAILAAISIVAYTGIQNRVREAAISSKESQAKKKLEVYKVKEGQYPSSQSEFDTLIGQNPSDQFYTTYSSTPPYDSYTISTSGGSGSGGGGGAIADGSFIQTITNANCPTTRTRAVDARDNRTYWVQKMDDGKCWMLTNLAYAGGGTNTYSDTIPTTTLTNGTSDTSTTYTAAKYYVPTGANPTTEPTNPSTSTDGTGQYGYLYNFCAANGGQTGNGACSNSSAAVVDTSVSVCPAGWRLPTGVTGGELKQLTTAINAPNSTAGSTVLREVWLAQRGGLWHSGFNSQGAVAFYWSSSQSAATDGFSLASSASSVLPTNSLGKHLGLSVRCVAL